MEVTVKLERGWSETEVVIKGDRSVVEEILKAIKALVEKDSWLTMK